MSRVKQIIWGWSFDHVEKKLRADGYSTQTSRTLVQEMRKFLFVVGENEDLSLGMAGPVDDAWHEAILHTKDYAEFCNAAFGRFIHHIPINDELDVVSIASYKCTLQLIENEFGSLNKCWPDASLVSNCAGKGCGGDVQILSCSGDAGGGTTNLYRAAFTQQAITTNCGGGKLPPVDE